MTYDDVKRQDADQIRRELPWKSEPGTFLVMFKTSASVDPHLVNAASLLDAIAITRVRWRGELGTIPCEIIRSDSTERWFGSL